MGKGEESENSKETPVHARGPFFEMSVRTWLAERPCRVRSPSDFNRLLQAGRSVGIVRPPKPPRSLAVRGLGRCPGYTLRRGDRSLHPNVVWNWSTLNRLGTGHGRRNRMLHRRGLAGSASCDCGTNYPSVGHTLCHWIKNLDIDL